MTKSEIGETAGKVWQCLIKNGRVPLSDLPREVKADPVVVHEAIGWLAHEDKVEFANSGRADYVSLTDNELRRLAYFLGEDNKHDKIRNR